MLLWVAPGASEVWGVSRHFLYFESTCGCLNIHLYQELQALFQQRFDSVFKCHTSFFSNEYAVFFSSLFYEFLPVFMSRNQHSIFYENYASYIDSISKNRKWLSHYSLKVFNKKESNKILQSNKLQLYNLIHYPLGSVLSMFLTWCVFVMSVLRQYLVVVFRDKPLELWDIRTGTLLREMAKNFPTVTALVLADLFSNRTVLETSRHY